MPRIRRQARPSPRVPSQQFRLRRGPKPPDGVIRQLAKTLEAAILSSAHQDADPEDPAEAPPESLGPEWVAALLSALGTLGLLARRGVVGALPPGPVRDRARVAPLARTRAGVVTAAILGSLRRTLAAGIGLLERIARAVGVLTQWVLGEFVRLVIALARAAGARGYIWTTRLDEAVRPLHRLLEGKFIRWSSPPIAGSNGWRGHAGEAGGCRCMPFPTI